MTKKQRVLVVRIAVGAVLFVAGLFFNGVWQAALMLAAWLLAGYDVLWSALRNILRGRFLDEKFLMGLASCCAVGMREWNEAAAVMLFFQIGELFEQLAVNRSRDSVSALMDLRPDYAVVLRNGEEIRIEPEEVESGDVLIVRTGERIPVDGVVIEGVGTLDTSKITGEALPSEVEMGSEVVSGCVNLTGVLKIKASGAYVQSTVARILALVEGGKKSSAERMITKFARWYTPSVIAAAVLLTLVPTVFFGQPVRQWLTRSLTFLVISCPCALVISVPLSFFSGMGAAARKGVILKGGVALETLAKTDTLVFDKTGTLTRGQFSVLSAQGDSDLLRVAALCEKYSNHPVAAAIRASCPKPEGTAVEHQELAGYGITACIDGKSAAAGNRKLMEKLGITPPETDGIGTTIYVAFDGRLLGTVLVGDSLREDVPETLKVLKQRGITQTVMLTGDNTHSADHYAKLGGVDTYRAQLLPQEKVEAVETLLNEGKTVAFIGDGVNDAPVLTMASVGIAMGGVGSDAAVEAADAVILNDDLGRLPDLLAIAKKTCAIAKQNIAFALTVKGICLLLGALNYAPMWLAIFADVGVSVLAILNALRAQKG